MYNHRNNQNNVGMSEDKVCSTKNNDHWRVFKVIERIKKKSSTFYPHISTQVIDILQLWADKWGSNERWGSLLNKSTLQHEIEECIIALYYLYQGLETNIMKDDEKIIVIDVCAGKGFLSFLLSYMKHPKVHRIVMLEKAQIDWHHIQASNVTAGEENRPMIDIWEQTNLHDYDNVLERMMALPLRLALSGIHLCKQLGPSFCGLVNGLGNKVAYGMLVPCCMPRAITAQKNNPKKKAFHLSIQLNETKEDRKSRLDYMMRRKRLKLKPQEGPCFLCNDESHNLILCKELPKLPREEQVSIRKKWHSKTVPCWNCLQFGHYKSECPKLLGDENHDASKTTKNSKNHHAQNPPTFNLDVSNILKDCNPYHAYCKLLSTSIEKEYHDEVNVIESDLKKTGDHENDKKQERNWNADRKSIFIVIK